MIRTKQEKEVGARKFAGVDELLAHHEEKRRELSRQMDDEHRRLDAREELGSDPRNVGAVVTPDRVAVMVDIETLGTKAGCVVTDVAVVVFDPWSGEVYDERAWVLDHNKLREFYGKFVDKETFDWRLKQGWEPPVEVRDPQAVCVELGTFFLETASVHGMGLNELRIYAWRYSLDKTCLDDLFDGCGVALPWVFWQWDCAASICGAAGVKRKGKTSHVAVEDCRLQVAALSEAMRLFRIGIDAGGEGLDRSVAVDAEGDGWPHGVRRGDRFELADGFLTVSGYVDDVFVGLMDDGAVGRMSPDMVSCDLSTLEGRDA